ncbi:helicase-associated domain-containing protein [Paenibacillus hexagrammi]|uniref:Helicase-associated domain-containing protein n=1 Tax=Paenibacillus hexagrammi TaxID=2908839 RepID=A0ABY3SP74_9BACL|nr:helicase-associated domain-containing protein [Paenibacillus sp. YPD9-1]UJF35263.1 helicase-associated domain-containing protein [Paenibacillus sp. YPD9-1]
MALDMHLEPEEALILQERGLAQTLFHFLVQCAKQERLLYSAKGVLPKKQLQKLLQEPSLGGEVLRRTGLSFTAKDAYEPLVAVLLESAYKLNILLPDDQGIFIDLSALGRWLQLYYDMQEAELYKHWRQLYLPAPAWLHHCMILIENSAEQAQEAWHSLNDIAAAAVDMQSWDDGLSKEQVMSALLEQWIRPLQLFRWLELAVDKQGGLWFHVLVDMSFSDRNNNCFSLQKNMDEKPGHSATFYVQPDFELILPPDVPPSIEWEIASFAELLTSDAVRMYRINRESLKACESGYSAASVSTFLMEYACFEVPEVIPTTLHQWEQQLGKLYFEEVTLLRCKSAELAELVEKHPSCQPYLQEKSERRTSESKKNISRKYRLSSKKWAIIPKNAAKACCIFY